MASRTSTRQAMASSPPRNPQAARTRTLRSRSGSIDLGATPQVGRRTTRQGSVASIASNASKSKGKEKGKGRGVKASAPDLSVLTEDSENDSEPGSDEIEEIDFDLDDLNSSMDDSSQVAASKESQLKADEMKSNARKLKETMKAANKPATVEKETAPPSHPAQSGLSGIPAKASSSRYKQADAVPSSSTENVLDLWRKHEKDNNKENNRPAGKFQPRRAQEERGGPSKRSRAENGENDEDEDEAFQTDNRPADPSRRSATARPAKRTRVEEPKWSDDQPRRRRGQSEPAEQEDEPEDESEAPASPSMSAQVKATAKVNVQNAMAIRPPQPREKWTPHDEAELIRLIGEHGCSWTRLVDLGEWDQVRSNFQVKLKDKARTIKYQYLTAGTPLPPNFKELVRLGKNQIAAVRRVIPDYEQD